ncbi:MAG: chemotaxis protein CheW, partial [Actinomycetota bacterium]
LGGEVFAIDAGRIREILDHVPITEVPNARPFVAGLINVRGKVVPLADLWVRFGMARLDSTIDTRIVVFEVDLDGETTPVGVLADRVFEVTEITPAAVEETPRIGMRWRPDFIRGVGKRGDDFVIILDIDRVVGAPEQAEASLAAAE